MRAVVDTLGFLFIFLITIGTVIANLTFGVHYDLDRPNHPVAKPPKAKSTSTQARK